MPRQPLNVPFIRHRRMGSRITAVTGPCSADSSIEDNVEGNVDQSIDWERVFLILRCQQESEAPRPRALQARNRRSNARRAGPGNSSALRGV